MKSIDRIDIKKRWPIPTAVKLFLLVAVILGIATRNCWMKDPGKNLQISDIEIIEVTGISADVAFVAANRAKVNLKKSVIIRLFTKDGEEIASKISYIEIPAKSRKRYLKVLQKFNFPIKSREDIAEISVEWYK